ncbi:phage tail protein [Acidovorax sp. HDW3]|uniref:phage tail protein n=1 Tax=Acidovorax sp. HDW3 TaxID=2714923 RepID=UPI00140933C5|nr:phage tail protein [Acidovorax sp. HDW3]QIL44637.1 phage tail protein [Acidovorax sp. HDW3]
MLMALGQFVFGLDTLAFESLRRASAWRHPSQSRVGAMPARQYLGAGDDTITLSGVLAPEFRGTATSLAQLRDMAGRGNAFALVSGAGDIFGAYVIESLQETATLFVPDGRPRRIEFELQLQRVDAALSDAAGGTDPGGGTGEEDWWEWWL